MRNLTEILGYFLDYNKEPENLSEGLGVPVDKL
jgi:hypothetical protein